MNIFPVRVFLRVAFLDRRISSRSKVRQVGDVYQVPDMFCSVPVA